MNNAKISGGLALLLMILIPCQSRLLSAPGLAVGPIRQPADRLTGLDRAIYARTGELSALAFDIRLTGTTTDSVAALATVRVFVASGPGEVALLNDAADSTGAIHALFYALVPQGPSQSVVQVISSNDTATAYVTLFGASSPARLKISSPSPNIAIDFGQPRQFALQILATDDRGSPIRGLPVSLCVLSGAAQVESASVTDSTGATKATLTHLGTSLMPVMVAATVPPGRSMPPELKGLFQQAARYQGLKQILDHSTPANLVQSDTLSLPTILAKPVSLRFLTRDTTMSHAAPGQSLWLKALLSDESGRAIPGVSVRFETDSELGSVTPVAQTDLDGVARGVFRFLKGSGEAMVTATAQGLEVSDKVKIAVENADADTNTNAKGREDR